MAYITNGKVAYEIPWEIAIEIHQGRYTLEASWSLAWTRPKPPIEVVKKKRRKQASVQLEF